LVAEPSIIRQTRAADRTVFHNQAKIGNLEDSSIGRWEDFTVSPFYSNIWFHLLFKTALKSSPFWESNVKKATFRRKFVRNAGDPSLGAKSGRRYGQM